MKTLKAGIAGSLVGVYREALELVATNRKSLVDGIQVYTNYQELLKENLDVLFVAMTNDIAS